MTTADDCCGDDCFEDCECGRGRYRTCKHRSCYECFLDRRTDFVRCVFCGKWHSPEFDTCFKCRPETRGRDDAAKALRQLILWRDQYRCRYCGAVEGDMQVDPRLVRSKCPPRCGATHRHRIADDDGMRHTILHVDHVIPCAKGGRADEWNLQVLCNVCNISKGDTWYRGCRHEDARTRLARLYLLLAPSYFGQHPDRARFVEEVEAWRATGTWDPGALKAWARARVAAV